MAASSKGGRAASMSPEEIDRHRRESAEVSRRLCEASAKAVQALARDHLAAAGAVLPPLHLHARAVSLPLYPNRAPIAAEAAPPPHMLEALRRCGYGASSETPGGPGA